jgi:hypothetical protein
MNKRIIALSILLLMMCAMAVSVFADENDNSPTEYKWTVTVTYRDAWGTNTMEYPIWAATAREAEREAESKFNAEHNRQSYTFISANASR